MFLDFLPLHQVIKNPVSDHFPVGCMKIGTSFSVSDVSDVRQLVPSTDPVVFVVGAFAHGKVRSRFSLQVLPHCVLSTESQGCQHSAVPVPTCWELEGGSTSFPGVVWWGLLTAGLP